MIDSHIGIVSVLVSAISKKKRKIILDMKDYTPHHHYREIVDYIPEQKEVVRGKITGFVLLLIYITIIGSIITSAMERTFSIWVIIAYIVILLLVSLVLGIIFYLIYSFSSPGRQRLKSDYGNIIKSVVGFDFGEDYRLFYTGSHDHEEYLYIFTEKSFLPFRDYLESMKDGEIEGTKRCVSHTYKNKEGAGFTLVEDRLNRIGDGLFGNIECIIVDYEERTLKHTITIY